tara:strand:+ start:116 stop:457 length:342 start_codon:yes stop_codon:yes gene_type:complete
MFNKFQLGTQPATFLAKNKLSGASALVLLKIMYQINRVNMVIGTPQDIAKTAGITIGDFTVGIRALKRCDLIRKYTKKEYMLNPDVMFNGDDKQYFIVKHMWDTQTSKGLRTK